MKRGYWWRRGDLCGDNPCVDKVGWGLGDPIDETASTEQLPQWKHSRHLLRKDICQDIDRVCLSLGGGGCGQQNLKQSDLESKT